jgi:proteasome beta subunit
VFARGSLKKLYRDGAAAQETVRACVQALYDAADDDSATGGPDLTRSIYPVIGVVTADGYNRLSEAEAEEHARAVVNERMQSPDGPSAPFESS